MEVSPLPIKNLAIKSLYLIIGIAWIATLVIYANPALNSAFSGFSENDYPFKGVLNCSSETGGKYSFSLYAEGTTATLGREGNFGNGDPYIEVTNDKYGVKVLRFAENWHCTDSFGKSDSLFTFAD